MKNLLILFAILSLTYEALAQIKTIQYLKKPKLVIVLVIDQFRADYITRFSHLFLPAQSKKLGGFNFLIEKGAYFPFSQYEVLQNMTCPGHAMISTGSVPRFIGFSMNEWYDSQKQKVIYCVEDDKDGFSPRNLVATTFSDELKTSFPDSRIYSLALKDRAAILLGGHKANLAVWFNFNSSTWETSSYYGKEIPYWLNKLNTTLASKKLDKTTLSSPLGNQITTDLALQFLEQEQLGRQKVTDVLTVSYSAHDMLGHAVGMHANEMKIQVLNEDTEIARILNYLNDHHLLKDTVIALTGDHGIPPNVEDNVKQKVNSGKIDYQDIIKKISDLLNKKYGNSGNEKWVVSALNLHLYLNEKLLSEKKISLPEAESEIYHLLKKEEGIFDVMTSSQFANRIIPSGLEQFTLNSFVPEKDGHILIIPKPFFMEADHNHITHVTHYSYDSTVPLVLFGPLIHSGVYAQKVKTIDLAPTLSFILNTTPPSNSNGRVLNEIFH